MHFDITIIGYGVIGTETLFKIAEKFNKKQKLNIAIIEKKLDHVPGGVAYSKNSSKFGFFNNPLRLSNLEFINWVKKRKNLLKISAFIDSHKDFNLNCWLQDSNILNKKIKEFNELYLPRLSYSFFLEDKIKSTLENISKKKITLKFFEGELQTVSKNNFFICESKKTLSECKLTLTKSKIHLKKTKKKLKLISTKKIVLGNGLLPPKTINETKKFINKNYIWDFYTEGGTLNLIKKIKKIKKNKKKIKLIFIGNKAGLLETMPELENFISKNKIKLKIITISPNKLSLEKAENSSKFKFYKFRYLVNNKINTLVKSSEILNLLVKEFSYAINNGFNKYDVWTWVLKKNLIFKCYKQLSTKEKNVYNEKIFPQIRNLTRYTYPNTIKAKERLLKKKFLIFIKDKVVKLKKDKNCIIVYTKNNRKILSDIVINVSGPINLDSITNESPLVSSVKKINSNYNYRGFIADKNFSIAKNLYAPGTISSNFNPNRLTIIRAVTENSHKVANHLLRSIQ